MTTTILGQTAKGFRSPAYQYVRETDKLPSTDDAYAADDPLCPVKLFNPSGRGTWFIAGFDPDTGLAFGVADIFEREKGDFDLNEIVALRPKPFGLPIERDLYYDPRTIHQLLAETRGTSHPVNGTPSPKVVNPNLSAEETF